MSWIQVGGGTMDVDPNAIGDNIAAGSLLNAPEDVGTRTLADPPDSSHNQTVRAPASQQYGRWFKVPDDSVKLVRTNPLVYHWVWTLPNGSQVILDDSEVQCSFHWYTVTLVPGTHDTVDTSVKLTDNTRAGMIAFGFVDAEQASDIIQKAPPEPPTLEQAVVSGSKALVVLAIVGAVIWFLPKGTFAKLGKVG